MLVLAGTSLIFLLRVKNTSNSTWMLLWFFLCVVLSSIATIVTNIGTISDWAFVPSQDALLILGGLFSVRYAYLYPQKDQTGEDRWVITFFVIMASAALICAVSFAIRYIAYLPGDLNENQLFYLLTPTNIVLAVFIFFRRSLFWSAQTDLPSKPETNVFRSGAAPLLRPNNRAAVALRNYGLSLAISLVPAIVLVEKTALPAMVASFLY